MGLFSPKGDRLMEKGYNNIYYNAKPDKGLQQIEEAAQAGNKTAIFFLAELYDTGSAESWGESVSLNVTPNPEKALALYRQLPQILRVKYRLAMFYASAPASQQNETLAWQLFKDVEQGKAEAGWEGLWMADRLCSDKASDEETLKRQAGMRAATMQFWGRGVQQDDAQVKAVLEAYESVRVKKKVERKAYWDPDAFVCLEALRLRQMGAEDYYGGHYDLVLESLVWAYLNTTDPATEQLLEDEMLVPCLIPRLQEKAQLDAFVGIRETVDAMQAVCRKKGVYSIAFGDAGYECLNEVESKFCTKEYYADYFSCLEKCSGGLGNLRATCLLAEEYIFSKVIRTSAVVSSRGREGYISEKRFEEEARRTLARMVNQIKVRKEGKRQGERAERGMVMARCFMDMHGEAAKKIAPEECKQIEQLLYE